MINYFKKASEFYQRKEYEQALDLFKKQEEISSGSSNFSKSIYLYNIGVCHMKLEQYQEGILYIERALLHNKNSGYYFNIGYCWSMLKIYDKAIIYFKKIINIKSLGCRV